MESRNKCSKGVEDRDVIRHSSTSREEQEVRGLAGHRKGNRVKRRTCTNSHEVACLGGSEAGTTTAYIRRVHSRGKH